MLHYQPRRRRLRSKTKRGFPLKGAFFLFLFLVFLGSAFWAYLHHQKNHLLEKKEVLLETKLRLSREIARLKKDPSSYEEIARQKYGLIKDNERLIIFGD